jgi:hypothetical protein
MVTPMKRVPGLVAFTLVTLSLWFVLHTGFAGAQKVAMRFEEGTMSASLSNVSLETVLENIREDHGIWYKTDVPLSGEKISLQFQGLPVEKGFKRILAGMNHVLVFDAQKGEVVGVVIFGKKKSSTGGPAKAGSMTPGTGMESPGPSFQGSTRRAFPAPGPVEGTEEEVQVFESVEEETPETEFKEGSVEEKEKPGAEEEGAPEGETAEATEDKEGSPEQNREAVPSGQDKKADQEK